MNLFDKIRNIRLIKKAYVRETFIEPDNVKEWLKRGLYAKKILKYKKDEYSFRWVVWYV